MVKVFMLCIFIIYLSFHSANAQSSSSNKCVVENLKSPDVACEENNNEQTIAGPSPEEFSSANFSSSFGVYTKRNWVTMKELEVLNGNYNNGKDPSIINGERAKEVTRKSLALIIVKTDNFERTRVCTGTILKKSDKLGLILTSASCFFDLSRKNDPKFIATNVYVKPGVLNRNKEIGSSANFFQVPKVAIKLGFNINGDKTENDVAVILIARNQRVKFSKRNDLFPVQLPPAQSIDIFGNAFRKVKTAGYGQVKRTGAGRFAKVLQEVDLVLRKSPKCAKCYPPERKANIQALNKNEIICAGGPKENKQCKGESPNLQRRGVCFGGDNGAPLFYAKKFSEKTGGFLPGTSSNSIFQVGVASFHDKECGFNSWYTNLLQKSVLGDLRKIMVPGNWIRGNIGKWETRDFGVGSSGSSRFDR